MTKRNLFEELKQGLKEIKAFKEKKITLRTHHFEKRLEKNLTKIDLAFGV